MVTHELGYPFGHMARCIAVLNHVAERGKRHDYDGVPLKVVQQLSFNNEDGIDKLLDLSVMHLSVRENFTDEVYWPLDLVGVLAFFSLDDKRHTDHLGGRGHVEKKRFPLLVRYQCGGRC